jgi:hypothetical protein
MSNEKFTPGPWAIQQVHQILWVGTPKRNGQLDELILHINQDVSYKDEKKERNLANAKLIAAAPDLYAALVECLERLEMDYPSDNVRILKAKAAIAKATQ